MARVLLICQYPNCKKEFHDIGRYYEHVTSHDEEKKVKKES